MKSFFAIIRALFPVIDVFISTHEHEMVNSAITDIMIRLGFVKESFKPLENHTIFSSKEREYKDLQEKAAEDFVQDVRSISYGIIYRAIESLKKRRLITCIKVIVIDGTVADIDTIE